MQGIDITERVRPAVSRYYPEATVTMLPKKDYFYAFSAKGGIIEIRMSDYLADAPDPVLEDVAESICLRAKGKKVAAPVSFLEYVRDPDFITQNRPTYIRRSKNLTRSDIGTCFALSDSLQRLMDSGLILPSDIENSYISWTRRDSARRLGFCSTMFRVVGISSILDSEDVPDDYRDYVVYHECLHLRQGYRSSGTYHTQVFRNWERMYPGWQSIEAGLRKLGTTS